MWTHTSYFPILPQLGSDHPVSYGYTDLTRKESCVHSHPGLGVCVTWVWAPSFSTCCFIGDKPLLGPELLLLNTEIAVPTLQGFEGLRSLRLIWKHHQVSVYRKSAPLPNDLFSLRLHYMKRRQSGKNVNIPTANSPMTQKLSFPQPKDTMGHRPAKWWAPPGRADLARLPSPTFLDAVL